MILARFARPLPLFVALRVSFVTLVFPVLVAPYAKALPRWGWKTGLSAVEVIV
jgi:hypothetical protein